MPASDRAELARALYRAYETGDRELLERLIADPFEFWSPRDDGIDRATYFERCWPAHELHRHFAIDRIYAEGDEVVVTYDAERTDGSRFRNTEVFTFAGDRCAKVEVYFGWNL
jgi:ketosteroid isomerase-like protein